MKLINETFIAEKGDKYYIVFNKNEFWGINVVESDYNSKLVKLEVYKDIYNNRLH